MEVKCMFCAECGTQFEGNFCPNCGVRAGYTRMNQPAMGSHIAPLVENKDITGIEYEALCARYIVSLGYSNIETTKKSGDQGVDIIAFKNGYKYAIQCKYYNSPVGNSAIQEVVAGASYYNCHKKIVITNSTFTQGAIALAKSNDVLLMPGITKGVINSSLFFRQEDVRTSYARFQHSLPKKEDYHYFVSNNDLEQLYKESITKLEINYKYLCEKDISRYRPTNTYNSASWNAGFGLDDRLNKTLEGYVKALLKAFLDDGLLAQSTRLHQEKRNVFEIYFKINGRLPIEQIQLDCIQAHLNSTGVICVYDMEIVDDYNFKLMISKRNKKIDTKKEHKRYEKLKIKYHESTLRGKEIEHYTDANLSKKWFSQLEKEVFESVGYYLYFSQVRVPVDYILTPIKLFNVEYNSLTGSITFLYYCQLDFRYYLDRRYHKYTKDIQIADKNKCVLQISAKVFIDDYSILKDDIFMSVPLSSSRIKKKITDLDSMIENHPFTQHENILLMHPYDFFVEKS